MAQESSTGRVARQSRRRLLPILALIFCALFVVNAWPFNSWWRIAETFMLLGIFVGTPAIVLLVVWLGRRAVRWRPRFTLRTLLGVTLLVSLVLSFVITLTTVVLPRANRARAYHALVSDPERVHRLSITPCPASLPVVSSGTAVHLGYAQMELPAAWSFTLRQQGTRVVLELSDGSSVQFLPPFSPDYEARKRESLEEQRVIDAALPSAVGMAAEAEWKAVEADEDAAQLLREIADDPMSWEFQVANVQPRSSWAVFMMPKGEFLRFWTQSRVKASCLLNDNGIQTFKTNHIRGLIRLGGPERAGEVAAEFSKSDGRVCQGIAVMSSSAEQSLQYLLPVLATYRLDDDSRLEQAELKAAIRRALQLDPRSVPERSEP